MGSVFTSQRQKRVAVVGGGPAGLAFLRVFKEFDLDWEVVLFEARDEIGGVWYRGDDAQPDPGRSKLPASPIYNSLTTTLPVNMMAFHDYRFPPGTALFPQAPVVQQYLLDFADDFDIRKFIQFRSRVEEASWRDGAWNIRVAGQSKVQRFDHLVVANGHYNKPYEPNISGLRDWGAVRGREVMHSTWYREPSPYAGKRVLVVGGGSSGRDLSNEIAQVALETYHSAKEFGRNDNPNPKQRPAPTRFEAGRNGKVIYTDGSIDEGVDVVILATGYEISVPFLSHLIAQPQPPTPHEFPPHLWNSGVHIYPLAQHVLPISDALPPTSVAFIGLPTHVAPFPLFEAQAAAAVRVFANPQTFRIEEEKDRIRARNKQVRDTARGAGGDELRTVGRLWHRISDVARFESAAQFEYRDELLRFAGVTKWLTDAWLPAMYAQKVVLREEWADAARSGEGEELVRDATTKDDWYRVLLKLLDRAERRRRDAEEHVEPAGNHAVYRL
ncbi:hypothetical protein M407DRAFT_28594 [Tulasnella calospora MUT 4182]|uniref:FAD/NAD(P)-binding domain-containing protein n=1 Tax=Tulasnella calospora MUT 4182 TaxID=1051891 RepID=A0A0C3LKJ2_9AGAM|nr:hypothetical protein M407DRAFT_28594 [Tulasnella calospora MUT 4182]